MSRGRGRGRGRGKSFEALGLAPGESAPPPILQPPPLFPTLDRRPLSLKSSDVETYLVTVKQDLRQYMTQSPFHLIRPSSNSVKIAKYSDRHRKNGNGEGGNGWKIDWKYFPSELRVGGKRLTAKGSRKEKPSSLVNGGSGKRSVAGVDLEGGIADPDEELLPPKTKKSRRKVTFDKDSNGLEKKLESLEKTEQLSAESEQSAEEENTEDVYEEEEEEEGTDYNLTYFDNGEDYDIGDDDTLEEGPVY